MHFKLSAQFILRVESNLIELVSVSKPGHWSGFEKGESVCNFGAKFFCTFVQLNNSGFVQMVQAGHDILELKSDLLARK